jgi:hypothetical protein
MSIAYLSQNVRFNVDDGERDVSGLSPFEKSMPFYVATAL